MNIESFNPLEDLYENYERHKINYLNDPTEINRFGVAAAMLNINKRDYVDMQQKHRKQSPDERSIYIQTLEQRCGD